VEVVEDERDIKTGEVYGNSCRRYQTIAGARMVKLPVDALKMHAWKEHYTRKRK